MASGNRPVHEIRMRSIKAAIWMNSYADGRRYSVTFTRLYKDGDQWKDSPAFGRDDLQLLAKVADQAHTWIFDHAETLAAAGAANSAEGGDF